jgi:hypothetical protein
MLIFFYIWPSSGAFSVLFSTYMQQGQKKNRKSQSEGKSTKYRPCSLEWAELTTEQCSVEINQFSINYIYNKPVFNKLDPNKALAQCW